MDAFDLVPLKSVEVEDFRGWHLPLHDLRTYRRGQHPFNYIRDEFIEAPDGKYSCLMYTIFEQRMGWYLGHVAIFADRGHPRLLACSAPAMMHAHPPPQFLGDFCVLRAPAFHQDATLAGDPLIVVDLRAGSFGFIDVGLTSCWYDLTPVGEQRVELKSNENVPEKVRNRATPDQVLDLSTVQRHPLGQLPKYAELFRQARRGG